MDSDARNPEECQERKYVMKTKGKFNRIVVEVAGAFVVDDVAWYAYKNYNTNQITNTL